MYVWPVLTPFYAMKQKPIPTMHQEGNMLNINFGLSIQYCVTSSLRLLRKVFMQEVLCRFF